MVCELWLASAATLTLPQGAGHHGTWATGSEAWESTRMTNDTKKKSSVEKQGQECRQKRGEWEERAGSSHSAWQQYESCYSHNTPCYAQTKIFYLLLLSSLISTSLDMFVPLKLSPIWLQSHSNPLPLASWLHPIPSQGFIQCCHCVVEGQIYQYPKEIYKETNWMKPTFHTEIRG